MKEGYRRLQVIPSSFHALVHARSVLLLDRSRQSDSRLPFTAHPLPIHDFNNNTVTVANMWAAHHSGPGSVMMRRFITGTVDSVDLVSLYCHISTGTRGVALDDSSCWRSTQSVRLRVSRSYTSCPCWTVPVLSDQYCIVTAPPWRGQMRPFRHGQSCARSALLV